MAQEIFSLEIEKQVIAGLLQHSEWIWEVDKFLNESDFYSEVHKTIFIVIKRLLDNKETVDKVIIAEKIKGLGISLEINIFEYCRALNVFTINKEGFIQSVKELKKLSIRREIAKTGQEIARAMQKDHNFNYDQIIANAQNIFNKQINLYENNNEPVDLFKGIRDIVEKIGNDPKEDGLISPHRNFQKMFGSLTGGDLYVISALFGIGKSTFLDDLVLKICTECNPTRKIKALILDTELETQRVQFRNVGSLAGISPYLIRTGKWRNNAETLEKVRSIWPRLNELENHIDHIYIGSMGINEVTGIIKRWANKNLNNEIDGLICYDYLKITEKIDDSNKEYQVMGEKVNELKKIATELRVPIITAVQLNRQNDIAISQRIGWYASYLFKLEKKSDEELSLFGHKFGTHNLKIDKTREWGEEGHNIGKLLEYTDRRGDKQITKNYLNFSIENFNVREIGTAEDMINEFNLKFKIHDDSNKEDGLL